MTSVPARLGPKPHALGIAGPRPWRIASAAVTSNDAACAQVGDGRLGIPKASQDLDRMLAEVGGRPHGRRLRRGAHVDGLPDDPDFAELGMLHRAGNAQVLDLWFRKRLIDGVDRSAGN